MRKKNPFLLLKDTGTSDIFLLNFIFQCNAIVY